MLATYYITIVTTDSKKELGDARPRTSPRRHDMAAEHNIARHFVVNPFLNLLI